MKIEVRPYEPTWPARFEAVAADLYRALADIEIVAIEHVGSTSVPGLAAKPILDIDVIVTEANVQAATDALAAAGYTPRGDLGVPDRYARQAPDTDPQRHLYVVVHGSLSLRNHLGVRDVLRSDRELRDRYGALKLDLAAQNQTDVDRYVADKTDLLELILTKAGLTPTDLAAIRKLNSSGPPTS